MKILEIASEFPPGPVCGIGRYVEELSKALIDLGHEVHVLTGQLGSPAPEDRRDGLTVHFLREQYPFWAYNDYLQGVLTDLPTSERLLEVWAKVGPFDLVATHDWAGSLVAALGQRVFKCPLVATLHGTQPGRSGGKLTREEVYVADMERWLCERADRVTVPSEFARSEVEGTYSVPRQKVMVVPDGAGSATFSAEVDIEEFRSMFASPDESLVLFAGRLQPAKGPDLFLEAITEVLARRSSTRAVVAGDGPMREALLRRIEAERLEGRIRLVGHVGPSVLGALYQAADLLAVPSRYEASGIAALEGLLHDLPIVGSEVGGLAELGRISDRVRLVPAEDVRALSRAVIHALDAGRPDRQLSPSDERIPARFAWQNVARAMEEVYESLFISTKG